MTPRPTRDEKPLNAQVAEALGCPVRTRLARDGRVWVCGCEASVHSPEGTDRLYPYGEDSPVGWACTGPLMSKYRIEVVPYIHAGSNWWAAWLDPKERIISGSGESRAEFYERAQVQGPEAPTAPAAICALILMLSESGRLAVLDEG